MARKADKEESSEPDPAVDQAAKSAGPLLNWSDFNRTWGSLAFTAATGVSYAFGYAEIARLAGSLSLNPTDLGFDLSDYVLLTVISLAALVIIAEVGWFAFKFGWTSQRWVRSELQRGCIYWVVMLVVGGAIAVGWFQEDVRENLVWLSVATAVLCAAAGLVSDDPLTLRNPPSWWRSFFVPIVAFGIALGMFGTLDKASSWGEGLQTWARGGSGAGSGPPGLSLLMKPTRGHLDRDGAISCVVRLAGDAYLDEQGHTVLSPGGTFVADEICQPTTSTTAPVESTATSAP